MTSQLKVCCLFNLAGVGGGDQLLFGILREAPNLVATSVFVDHESVDTEKLARGKACLGTDGHLETDWHLRSEFDDDDQYHKAIVTAANHADVVLTWNFRPLTQVHDRINTVIVDAIQGTSHGVAQHLRATELCSDRLVCISQAAKRLVSVDRQHNATVIYSGAEPARVVPMKGRTIQRKLWAREGIPLNAKVALFVGRLEAGKNAVALVKAISQLPKDWVGVIIGEGSLESEVGKQAANFAPGRIYFAEDPWLHLGDALAGSDVLLVPSDAEGDPIVVHEAHLAGVPVVASDLPVYQEHQSRFGKMSELVPIQADGVTLAKAILETQQERFKAVTANAFRATWNHFTIPAIAGQWSIYLEEVVQQARRRRLSPRVLRVGNPPRVSVPAAVNQARPSLPVPAPRVDSSDRPVHLHCIYDVENWAYHNVVKQLQKHCPPDIKITAHAALQQTEMPPDVHPDVVLLFLYGKAARVRQDITRRFGQRPLITSINIGPDRRHQECNIASMVSDVVLHNSAMGYHHRSAGQPNHIYLPNGVDTDLFRPTVGWDERPNRVLWVGSEYHREIKRYDLIDSIRSVLEARGIELDARLVDSKEAPFSQAEMAEWYNTGKVFACTSSSEGTPNPCLEAAASGTTLVTTPVGNMPELVCPGTNGLFLRKPDVERLFRVIEKAIAVGKSLAAEMLETIQEDWTWEKRVEVYYQLVRDVAAGRPPVGLEPPKNEEVNSAVNGRAMLGVAAVP